ncbi:DUF4212 domain-containing protein [Candidatus Viridilinea mediisalina]|uniref:Sodium symporter small subunit domain-containing protein n=1 Tax=Candidatus Viridilinea mediisalina TaxID=2024553 RepID=A0A2A6RH40_9CHLR|nr:DUF4212 domain-containing protein [Candidatus Viridilinea mediisalina]PDW02253.1 hypothetical protein CJ255_14920 [Candidatus Viridilinea mediisalina]
MSKNPQWKGSGSSSGSGSGRGKLSADEAAAYWKSNVTIIGILLALWFIFSFVTSYFLAGPLSGIMFGGGGSPEFGGSDGVARGVPLSFWMAQQGGIFAFIIIIVTYAKLMDNLDKKYGLND